MARPGSGAALQQLLDVFATGSAVGLDDEELLLRYVRSRDPAAFEALVQRHGPMVLATCRAVLLQDHDAEDAFQATFLVLARKAESIRDGHALGAWLHRVAYRASVQAAKAAKRRRRKESEASLMPPPNPSRPEPEWTPILHEEINRLPDRHRLPVVLCDLEGLTYDQAAARLGWTIPTLRTRLAKARQRLKARLLRRGISALALGILTAPPRASAALASAAVPPSLIKAAVSAASGGSASAGALLLAQILLRGMLMTKLQAVSTLALSTVALASASIIAVGAGKADDPKPDLQKPAASARPSPENKAEKPADTEEIRGLVLNPDGQPVSGALVQASSIWDIKNPPTATSGSDGRFVIQAPKAHGHADSFRLIAWAPTYGLGWTQSLLRPDRPAEQTVRLPKAGPPISGRVIDLEGRPVEGASVTLYRLWFEADGQFDDWLARARKGAEGFLWRGLWVLSLTDLHLDRETTTDADGHFEIAGIGPDCITDLAISGPKIATEVVHVLDRDEPEIHVANQDMYSSEPLIIHPPKFQIAVSPTKPIEGTIRDAESGGSISNVRIGGMVYDEDSLVPADGIETHSDADGHYRLEGLPAAKAYRLFLSPDEDAPYLNATLKVTADSPAFEPVPFDIKLRKGLVVRGRVIDKATGLPAQGAAYYYAFSDNPHAKNYYGSEDTYLKISLLDDQGRYTLTAIPGRGLVTVRAGDDRALPASGYEKIKGYDPESDGFDTTPRYISSGLCAAIAEVNLDPDGQETTLDLQTDSGRSVTIKVVGPDGKPLEEPTVTVRGYSAMSPSSFQARRSSGFKVSALSPGHPRRLVVSLGGRKLIGSALLTGDEQAPVVVKLQPWGTVSGRIIDDNGHPRKDMFLSGPSFGIQNPPPETDDILPGSNWNYGIRVSNDGRFEVQGLVPGLRYSAGSHQGNFGILGFLFKNVVVAPGEHKDLGDLKVQPPKKAEE